MVLLKALVGGGEVSWWVSRLSSTNLLSMGLEFFPTQLGV